MVHEKTIAQSRDRQGADPLADARGSVNTSIFGAVFYLMAALISLRSAAAIDAISKEKTKL
jgi:hypothetical protein